MPAKNTRRDSQSDSIALSEANAKVYEWTARAVELRSAGRESLARAAEREAKHWFRKAMDIEAPYPPASRELHAEGAPPKRLAEERGR